MGKSEILMTRKTGKSIILLLFCFNVSVEGKEIQKDDKRVFRKDEARRSNS